MRDKMATVQRAFDDMAVAMAQFLADADKTAAEFDRLEGIKAQLFRSEEGLAGKNKTLLNLKKESDEKTIQANVLLKQVKGRELEVARKFDLLVKLEGKQAQVRGEMEEMTKTREAINEERQQLEREKTATSERKAALDMKEKDINSKINKLRGIAARYAA